ncbi:CoA transferase [Alsobacter sp. SYSU M60028]|uniref:CoA transferase n=1 Tax=Alsobacter ponti TaxID=2962936 RepID=A0ABT1LEV8_9HYPH|nr:CaiB/BaiF CoA-transferase family protein [Alsobacter ponti]MCP8939994.1 CoA transferase [Alsobacter ponti]
MNGPERGALADVRVLEFAGIGPVPFCGMLLADLGADVVRVDRKSLVPQDPLAPENRGRRSIALDLKSEEGRAAAMALMVRADIVIEGYRPGVMERLGLGPDVALANRPSLVYGRMTGWGQDGPSSRRAGHDINYIAISGALHAIGTADRPQIPLNLVGDYGGGALHLALGVLAALHHARATGQGQVVDCAMSDAAVSLLSMIHGRWDDGTWRDSRESNVIDGGAHFYNVYQCRDGHWIAVGAIEPQFYRELIDRMGIDDPQFDDQLDEQSWPKLKQKLAAIFAGRTRAEWCALLEDSDACFAPVLSLGEAPLHPHNRARGAYVVRDGKIRTGPAPKLSLTPSTARPGARFSDEDGDVVRDWAERASPARGDGR